MIKRTRHIQLYRNRDLRILRFKTPAETQKGLSRTLGSLYATTTTTITTLANSSLCAEFPSSENKNVNRVSAYLAFSRIPPAVRTLGLGSLDLSADKIAMPRP